MAQENSQQQVGEVRLLPSGQVVGTMTWEQFMEWADEDVHAEWVAGQVIVHRPASDRHQDIVRFLVSVLSFYVEAGDLGVVRPAPFQMKLGDVVREPDLLFVAQERLDRVRDTYLDGPADLVIEIVSPDSAGRDRGEKYYEYEGAGVTEYWLIDPDRRQAEFYQLTDAGRYRTVRIDPAGRYDSAVLAGFWLDVNWLWQQPLPKLARVLQQLGVWPAG